MASSTWKYISGNKLSNTPADYNNPYPGAVYGHTMVLDSTAQYLYIFGGFGYDNGTLQGIYLVYIDSLGYLNDLWLYDLTGNIWEYISGNQSITTMVDFIYPYPGGLSYHTMSIDSTNRYLYIFGGQNAASSSLNDLWKYDTISTTWEYLNGSKSINTLADFDTPYPGGVFHSGMAIDSKASYLYTFGGLGYDNSTEG